MQTIALSALTLSTANVRKTGSNTAISGLADSIKAHGLQQNLLVVKNGKKYEVIAGGRRLQALKLLESKGEITGDYPVNCEVREKAQAEELSLVENVMRVAMHPADEYEAFATLIQNGAAIEEVALRFGVNEKHVRQRLKLARVSPALIQLYREGALTGEAMEAFTLTDDHCRQEEVYTQYKHYHHLPVGAIRRALTETSVPASHKFARFIGIEAYEAAGGTVRRDLFSTDNDSIYFDDVELLERLTAERLEEVALPFTDKWQWVEVRLELDSMEERSYKKLQPQKFAELPEGLEERFEELTHQLEEMGELLGEEEEAAIAAELASIQETIDSCFGYTEEERASAGCIVTINHNGLHILQGLVRPAEKEEEEKAKKPKEAYSQKLKDSIALYRLQVTRARMANNFETAFDSAVYMMAVSAFSRKRTGYWLDLHARGYHIANEHCQEKIAGRLAEEEKVIFNVLPLAWLEAESETERFNGFCALLPEDKQKLFSACIARSLQPQFGGSSANPVYEAVISRLNLNMAAHFRPKTNNFFARIGKVELLKIGQEIFGDKWVLTHTASKKTVIVEVLEDAFKNPEQSRFTPEQQEKLKAWLPKGM